MVNSQMEEVKANLSNDAETETIKELSKFNLQLFLYQEKTKYDQTLDTKVSNVISQRGNIYKANHTATFTRYLFPPYIVKQDSNNRYYLIRTKEYSVTSFNFLWRWKLFLKRLYAYSINVTLACMQISWKSPFGLKALCFYDFFTDYDVNDRGVIFECSPVSSTYPRSIVNLMNWILDSRREFESLPDEGLFGKGFSRILNLINNYVIRLCIYGPILLISYPIIIVLISTLGIVFAITSWLWTFISLIIYTLFCFTIYDFDGGVSSWFPGIRIAYNFLIPGCLSMALSLAGIVLHPVASLIVLIFAFVWFIIIYLLNIFSFGLIKLLAKIPKYDTPIAWKIGGPGVSTSFYNQISVDDALMLITSELEQVELNYYKRELETLLERPTTVSNNEISNLFNHASLSFNIKGEVSDSIYKYKQKLNDQVYSRINNFPQKPYNVRFSKGELAIILKVGIELLMDLNKTKKFGTYIWDFLSLPENAWSRLVEQLFSNAFGGSDFLEPLEDLDFRVVANKEVNNEYERAKKKILTNYNLETRVLNVVVDKKVIQIPNEVKLNEIYHSGTTFYFDGDYLKDKEKLREQTKQNLNDSDCGSEFYLRE